MIKKKQILFQKNKTNKYDEYLFSISQENLNKKFFLRVLTLLQINYTNKITLKKYIKSKHRIFSFFKIKIKLKDIKKGEFCNFFVLNLNKQKFRYLFQKSELLVLHIFYDKQK